MPLGLTPAIRDSDKRRRKKNMNYSNSCNILVVILVMLKLKKLSYPSFPRCFSLYKKAGFEIVRQLEVGLCFSYSKVLIRITLNFSFSGHIQCHFNSLFPIFARNTDRAMF